jgi:predicted DNA-binding transcriptional regulator AlpA
MRETAAILGVSDHTLRRLIRRGDGPLVTRLSERKVGVRDSDREAWLTARAGAGAEVD